MHPHHSPWAVPGPAPHKNTTGRTGPGGTTGTGPWPPQGLHASFPKSYPLLHITNFIAY